VAGCATRRVRLSVRLVLYINYYFNNNFTEFSLNINKLDIGIKFKNVNKN
jgi:hypothetical protein